MLFQNVSFALSEGGLVHVQGVNGAGKSSLLRQLAGALPLAAGQVRWAGEDFLAKGAAFHAARLCYLPPDDRALKLLETVEETLGFWADIYNVPRSAHSLRLKAAMESMEISTLSQRPVRQLSAGQKRRLSLARLMLAPRALWLLDEPLNGLDGAAADLLARALGQHGAQGGITVAASHVSLPAVAGLAVTAVTLDGACGVRRAA